MPTPINEKLYEKIKSEVYRDYPKHSAYRSMMIVKKYKDAGGKYKEDGKKRNTTKWLGERWSSVNDYYHDKKIIKCGSSDTQEKYGEYPLCKQLKVLKSLSTPEMKQMIAEKNKLKEKPLIVKKLKKTKK